MSRLDTIFALAKRRDLTHAEQDELKALHDQKMLALKPKRERMRGYGPLPEKPIFKFPRIDK